MHTSIRFTHDKVVFSTSNDIHAVLTLSAPKLDRTNKRPPICIIPVIDISGSMHGQKLDYVKRSVAKLIDQLGPHDYFGAVSYDDQVYDVFNVTAVSSATKPQMQAAITRLQVNGSTNLAGGMLRGIDFGKQTDLPAEVLIRVILFTDGRANTGPAIDIPGISQLLSANIGPRVTLSAFGYGNDADQELLTSLAALGKGNYAFIDSPDRAASAFAKELGGLLSTYAQNIKLVVEPMGENEITKVVSDVTVEDNGDQKQKIKIAFADLLSEETRHVVLSMRTSAQKQVFPRPINILNVSVTYDLIGDDGTKEHKSAEFKGKIEFVHPGDEQKKPTQEVLDIVAVHQVLEAQIAAEQMATNGDLLGAHTYLMGVQGKVGPMGCVGATNMVHNLVGHYASADSYTKSAGSRSSYRSVQRSRNLGADAGTEAVMFSCNLASANAVQADMMSAFSGGDPDDISSSLFTSAQVQSGQGDAVVQGAGSNQPAASPKVKKGLSKTRSRRW